MSRWSLPCCPPSGQVRDNICFQRCRNSGGSYVDCVKNCTVSCSLAKEITQNCCPNNNNIQRGCPNPNQNDYYPDSNPGNLDGPGGAIGGTFGNRQYCCAYSNNGATPCNTPSTGLGVCNVNNFHEGGGYANSDGLGLWFKGV